MALAPTPLNFAQVSSRFATLRQRTQDLFVKRIQGSKPERAKQDKLWAVLTVRTHSTRTPETLCVTSARQIDAVAAILSHHLEPAPR